MRLSTMFVVVVLGVLPAANARAQESSAQRDRSAPVVSDTGSRDFLFGRPKGAVGFRGNWLFARADSNWYSFVTDQLTLDRKDFNAPGFAFDVAFGVSRRADVVVGVDVNQSSKGSEYRNFVGNDRLPINQTTRLRTVDLTGSLKFALTDRGLEVSRLAFVPRSLIPYVGVGGGARRYDLQQEGEFVDFADNSIFASTFQSAGWAPMAQVFGGVDVRVLKRVYVSLDGRYQWARATLGGRTWVGFDPIDLAGFKLAAGASLLF